MEVRDDGKLKDKILKANKKKYKNVVVSKIYNNAMNDYYNEELQFLIVQSVQNKFGFAREHTLTLLGPRDDQRNLT